MKSRVVKKAVSHLKDDIKGYKKQRKHIKEEIDEDKDLIKTLKGKKNGYKKKKACCSSCEKGNDCEGSKGKARKRVQAKKKTRRK